MPFGLKNAPSEFQHIMDQIIRPFDSFAIAYIDDVLIFSKDVASHFKHLEAFRKAIERYGMALSATQKRWSSGYSSSWPTNSEWSNPSPWSFYRIRQNFPWQDYRKKSTSNLSFLLPFSFLSYYYQDLAADRKILSNRLRKNAPKQWAEVHTKAVQRIKAIATRIKVRPTPSEPDRSVPYWVKPCRTKGSLSHTDRLSRENLAELSLTAMGLRDRYDDWFR